MTAQHLHASLPGGERDTGPRLKGAHAPIDFRGADAPLELSIFAAQAPRDGGKGVVLFDCLDLVDSGQRFDQQPRAHLSQSRRQGGRVLTRRNRGGTHRKNRAVVELLVHAHDRDACLGIAGENRACHRGRASMLGQEGGMDVDRTVLWDVQHRSRDDLPVRDDDQQVWLEPPQPLHHLRVADPRGLVQL